MARRAAVCVVGLVVGAEALVAGWEAGAGSVVGAVAGRLEAAGSCPEILPASSATLMAKRKDRDLDRSFIRKSISAASGIHPGIGMSLNSNSTDTSFAAVGASHTNLYGSPACASLDPGSRTKRRFASILLAE